MSRKLLLLLLFVFCCTTHSYGQGNAGKDFWVAFMDLDVVCERPFPIFPGSDDTIELYISSPHAAKIHVRIGKEAPYASSGMPAEYYDSFNLIPNKVLYIPIDFFADCRTFFSDYNSNNGIHITSDSIITVVAVHRYWQSKGVTSVLPSESIPYGPEYIVATNNSQHAWDCSGGLKDTKSPEFLIVGIAPISRIEITAFGQSVVRPVKPGIPFAITLKQGETFFYISKEQDLSGSFIRSKDMNSKFAVFAGNRLTGSEQLNSSGIACVDGNDHAFEQLLPTVYWGKSYTALPFKNLTGGYYLKITGSQQNTAIYTNGIYNRTLDEGEYFIYNVNSDSATRITSDRHISIAQFSKGTACGVHTAPKTKMGDLAQVMLIPDTFFTNFAMVNRATHVNIPKTGISVPENFVNVLVREKDTSQFTINKQKVPNNLWIKSPVMKGYRYAQLTLDSLNYTLNSSKGFKAYVYGYAVNEAYAYSAGADYKPVQNNVLYDIPCQFDTTRFMAWNTDSFNRYSWKFGDNSPQDTGNKVKHIYKDSGWFNTVAYFRHKRTNVLDSITKKLYIAFNGSQSILIDDTMICGKVDFPLYAKNFFYGNDKIYEWWDGHSSYQKIIKKAGQFTLKVTERSGCTYTDTINVTNFPYPLANFKSSDTSMCLDRNGPVTFTNFSTAPDSIVSNKWNFGDTILINNNASVKHVFKLAGKYNVKLTVRSVHGCEDDTVKTLNIAPSPLSSFKITSIDSCFNNNHVNLVNTTVIDSALHKNFKWFFSEGFFLSNENPSGPWNYAVPGKYSIRLVYANKYNCVDTMKKDVTIYSHPKSAIGFSKAFQCANDTVHFINKTTSTHTPVKSLWKFGDNSSDTASNPAHFYAVKGSYNIKLVSISPQGCKDSVSQQLKINGSPQANFSVNDSFQCLSGNRFLLANLSTTDTGSFISRLWSYDDTTFDSNTDNPSKTFKTAGQHLIQLKVVNIFGCKDSILKSVETKKSPDVLFKINDPSQCFNGHGFDLDYIPVSGNGTITGMRWYYKTDSAVNVSSVNNIIFPVYGKYPVRLKLFDSDGCSGEKLRDVFVNPEPVAKFDIPLPAQCFNGHSFSFTDQSTIPAGNISGFKWDFGDLTSSVVQNPSGKTYNGSGKYNVSLIVASDSGCVDTAFSIAEIYPNATINILPVPQVCLNDSSIFTSGVSISGGTITDYLWDFGDNQTSDKANAKHLYTKPGIYNISLSTTTDKNCKDQKTSNNWVTVHALPKPDFSHRTLDGGNGNTVITFTDITNPIPRSLLWDFDTFGQSVLHDTSLSIKDSVTIRARLYVTDNNGCKGMAEKYIFVSPPSIIFFPNAFSPNHDGHNDGFGPVGVLFASNYSFKIYNRWGELVFKSETPGETWDGTYQGKVCPNGLFHYHVELNDFNGVYKLYDGMVLLMW